MTILSQDSRALKGRFMSNYRAVPKRASQPATTTIDDPQIYNTRMPSGTVRWNGGRDVQVIERGNQRLVIHREPPKGRHGWGMPMAIGAIGVLLLVIAVNMVANWWSGWQADATYGYPRIWQTDAVVGHNDSTDNPSHFQFENLHGRVLIIEIPGGDVSHAKIYTGPSLAGDGADQIPVKGEFKDETGRGSIDMVAIVNGQRIVYLNDGAQFKQKEGNVCTRC
jgi:hypothetical protein